MRTTAEIGAPKLWIVLARCHRALALSVERSIADLGLCLSDFMVLEALLHKGPLTISEIQGKVLLASGSMTAAADRVESRGLAIRKTTPKDRRARILELTPQGRRLIEGTFTKHAQHLEKSMSVLNGKERKQLYAGLKKLGQFVAATLDRPHPKAETIEGR
jgi:MarR family transcriptional regulator, 2-MHQ and catechol-resistance regulon repressor